MGTESGQDAGFCSLSSRRDLAETFSMSMRGRIGGLMDLGKMLIFIGAALVVAGIAVMLLGRMHLPLGRLPGDFLYRGRNTTFYFPLATSVLLSIVLSILLYVASHWRR
jgi:hypothetical protein